MAKKKVKKRGAGMRSISTKNMKQRASKSKVKLVTIGTGDMAHHRATVAISVRGNKAGGKRKATNYKGFKTIGVNKSGKSYYKFDGQKGVFRHSKTTYRRGDVGGHTFVDIASKKKLMCEMTKLPNGKQVYVHHVRMERRK